MCLFTSKYVVSCAWQERINENKAQVLVGFWTVTRLDSNQLHLSDNG